MEVTKDLKPASRINLAERAEAFLKTSRSKSSFLPNPTRKTFFEGILSQEEKNQKVNFSPENFFSLAKEETVEKSQELIFFKEPNSFSNIPKTSTSDFKKLKEVFFTSTEGQMVSI